jgi:RNA polymerase sigma-70 factor (ECF subfamily)
MAGSRSSRSDRQTAAEDRLDSELLERVAAGDRRALRALYERYYHPLLRFLQRLTGDLGAAQEGVNDVMLVVWDKAASFGGRSKVSTWIMGIAYRKAMRLRVRLHNWRARFKAADWSGVIEPKAGTEAHMRELVTQDLLYRAIQRLAPKQRAVIELTYYYGFSYEEIAEIVQCPENTVKTRMFHARTRLKEILPQLGQRDTEI